MQKIKTLKAQADRLYGDLFGIVLSPQSTHITHILALMQLIQKEQIDDSNKLNDGQAQIDEAIKRGRKTPNKTGE